MAKIALKDSANDFKTADTAENRFGIDNGVGGFKPLVELRNQQSMVDTGAGAGLEVGRGCLHLKDTVYAGGRELELGFYAYGAGIFGKLGGTNLFEFHLSNPYVSLRERVDQGGTNVHQYTVFEARSPVDAEGTKLMAGYHPINNRLGGHVWFARSDVPGPLTLYNHDLSGFRIHPGGLIVAGGEDMTDTNNLTLQLLAGSVGQRAALDIGYYNVSGDQEVTTWRISREASSQRLLFKWLGDGVGAATKEIKFLETGQIIAGEDFHAETPGQGLVVVSPDGLTRKRWFMDNTGAWTSVVV